VFVAVVVSIGILTHAHTNKPTKEGDTRGDYKSPPIVGILFVVVIIVVVVVR